MMRRFPRTATLPLLCLAVSGCQREAPQQYQSSPAVLALSPELQTSVRTELARLTGTFATPRLLGDASVSLERLKHGQFIYQTQCVQCHGASGDGNGPTANSLYPRPRDYRRGIFKFTSTRYGAKPLRSDLVGTVTRGIRGTSMPSFKLLPRQDIEAVVDYVMVLTHRGELEEQLAVTADFEGEIDPALVDEELVPIVLQKWSDAKQAVVTAATPQPELTAEHVQLGRTAFLEKGCAKCHGEDGRAQTAEDPSKVDAWGNRTRPADLTSGMLRGGQEPMDIYRRIHAGINGTPMPAFDQLLKDEPETVWNMVAYVLYVADRRREGEAHPPAYLRPYLLPPEGESNNP